MFEIKTDASRSFVHITVSGMLSADDVAEIYRREHAAIKEMGCPIGAHVLLIDAVESNLQTQVVIEAIKANMARPTRARRIAVATGQSLSKMQARRLLAGQPGMVFATAAEGEAWLFADPLEQAA